MDYIRDEVNEMESGLRNPTTQGKYSTARYSSFGVGYSVLPQ